jgi:hypothetical protein
MATGTTRPSRGSTRFCLVLVADLRHFLDFPHDTPGPARRLAEHLRCLVRAATTGEAGAGWVSALPCRRRPGNRRCAGRMIVRRDDRPGPIAWECSSCGDAGLISGWEDSPDDLRGGRPTSTDRVKQIRISDEVASTLREMRLLDADGGRVVYRMRAHEDDLVLTATGDELDELIGSVAAEANHEPNRRRQQRLDDAFDVLSKAAENPRRPSTVPRFAGGEPRDASKRTKGRNLRFHADDRVPPTPHIQDILTEIDRDPTWTSWG